MVAWLAGILNFFITSEVGFLLGIILLFIKSKHIRDDARFDGDLDDTFNSD